MSKGYSSSVEEATNYHLNASHAIDVCEDELRPDRRRLGELQQKLITPPRILRRSAGRPTCSIFKVNENFVDVNGKYYQPQIVSIGPFHHGKPHLQMIQEHKYHYLSLLLERTNLSLEELFQTLAPIENLARDSYSEEIPLNRHNFVELLVVDACFVIELFRKVARLVQIEHDDPVLSMSWIFVFLMRDLLRLENQLPFFVLQRLFDRTRGTTEYEKSENASLMDICFRYFGYAVERPPEVVEALRRFQPKHLLDLYRTSFIPADLETRNRNLSRKRTENMPSRVIHPISKLRRAGIEIRTPSKKNTSSTFLSVRFLRNGVIEMPTVAMDDFMCSFFANCVAYELCHFKCQMYFTTYTALLDYLVNSWKDVAYLSSQNVIDNYLGTETEVAEFINNLGKDAPFDSDNCYLLDLFQQVNHYHDNSWNVYWASFKFTYFNTPWSAISAATALVLLVLTIFQTLYGVFDFYKRK